MAEMRVIIGALREDVELCMTDIGFVIAGAQDTCIWENDLDGWDAFSRRQREYFDPNGTYEWREITVEVADKTVEPLFISPTVPGDIVAS